MATILVVDDSATNRALLLRILRRDDHRIIEAANGAEALGLVRVEAPDLVITDVLMPKVDGYQLLRELRDDPRTADLPVIIHTAAYTGREVAAMVGASELVRVLPKPTEVQTVLDTVASMLPDGGAASAAEPPSDGHEHLTLLNAKLLQTVRELEVAERDREQLVARFVLAQEDERERIAGAVHDDSIQVMTAVAMRLELLARTLTDAEHTDRCETLLDTVRTAITRLRRLLFHLHPAELEREGLVTAIEAYLDQTGETTGYEPDVVDRLGVEPPHQVRVLLYRIVQEALVNVAKHADADSVRIELVEEGGGVHVTVLDDGAGFDVAAEQEPRHGHLGLAGMRQRAELAGGWWRVDSRPGLGTTVEAWIPSGGPTAKDGWT